MKKSAGRVILFSDKTPFSLVEMTSSDTGYYLAEAAGAAADDDVVHIFKERHYANLQVLAIVASDGGKCPLIFLEDKEHLTTAMYMKYLEGEEFPWANATYGDQWWWQQDGTSCHTANATQEFLAGATPHFFGKKDWHNICLEFDKLHGFLPGGMCNTCRPKLASQSSDHPKLPFLHYGVVKLASEIQNPPAVKRNTPQCHCQLCLIGRSGPKTLQRWKLSFLLKKFTCLLC